MTLPAIDNTTDFVAEPHLLVDKDGDKLCVVIKATFEHQDGPPRGVDGTFTLAPKARRRRVRAADVPWGKPEIASIRYPSDLCVHKPATDVIVVARAHAPGGERVRRFDCGVRLGKVFKVVRVTGPRFWAADGDSLTEPLAFASLDLRYDYAFGGFDDSDPERVVEDARNPVGRGIARDGASLDAAPAPQLEDPMEPIERASQRPKPASLGAIGRHYQPRRARWGTYDAKWLEGRAPILPADFDERANQAATPELVASPHFTGGEEGALTNLVPGGGATPFVLPQIRLLVEVRVRGREPETFRPAIDTVILDTLGPIEHRALFEADPELPPPPRGPLTVELVWRAAIVAPKRLSDATIVVREERRR